MTPAMRRGLGGLAILIVIAAAAVGFKLSGSPAAERARKLDVRRVNDCVQISHAIDLYYMRQHTLPARLTDLGPLYGVPLSVTDPATGEPYEYRTLGVKRYELCAAFTAPSDAVHNQPAFWRHAAGRQCFDLDVREVQR